MSKQTLVKIAILGGPIALGGALFFQSRIHANFRSQEFYTKSLELMDGYPAAIELMGKPIRVRKINLGDRRLNYTDGINARLAIPMKGSKESGTLHSWASRPDIQHNWQVDKLDLEVKGHQWTFFIHPKSRDRYQPTGQKQPDNETISDESEHDSTHQSLEYLSPTNR